MWNIIWNLCSISLSCCPLARRVGWREGKGRRCEAVCTNHAEMMTRHVYIILYQNVFNTCVLTHKCHGSVKVSKLNNVLYINAAFCHRICINSLVYNISSGNTLFQNRVYGRYSLYERYKSLANNQFNSLQECLYSGGGYWIQPSLGKR